MRIGRGCCRSENLPLWLRRRPALGRFYALYEADAGFGGELAFEDAGVTKWLVW
jgi:hypothetical protein